MTPYELAEVVLEVAEHMPDRDNNIPRAEWRWSVVDKAIEIIKAEGITSETDDIDEIIDGYFCREKALS